MKRVKDFYEKHDAIMNSIIITFCFFCFFIFTGPKYSMSGDVNVAELLASNTKDGYYFILPSLSAALRLFIHWFPNVNWWTVYSIFVMFSGLLILNLLIVRAIKGFAGISVAVIFSSFMWINMLGIDINYTQTASIAAITGMMLILESCLFKKKSSIITCYIIGCFYIFIAGETRFSTLILCLPFAVMCICYRCILRLRNKQANSNNKYMLKTQIFFPIMAIAIMICGIYGLHHIAEKTNPYWNEYFNEYMDERQAYDYAEQFPTWEDGHAEYEKVGIKQSWYNMVFQYYIEDYNNFNDACMQKLLNFKNESDKTFEASCTSVGKK